MKRTFKKLLALLLALVFSVQFGELAMAAAT